MRSRNPLLVEILRGPVVESVHQVMAVVADRRGLVTGYLGNVDYLVMPRSCIKPLQAIPFVESGAIEKFGLDDRMIAMACASHRGEKQHLLVLAEWLQKMQKDETVLHCGPAWPAHEGTAHEMIRKSLRPSVLINNCAGKHLGFVATALMKGEDPTGYQLEDHPVQERLRRVMSDATRVNYDKLVWGIDGCGIPTYALPLQALAIGGSYLLGETMGESRQEAVSRIFEAMRRHPQLVGGSDDFSSAIIEKTRGRTYVKSGAEGIYMAWMPDKGSCVALKVHDGHKRAAEVAMGSILRILGGLTESEFLDLRTYTMPDILNSRGERVGEIRLEKR